MSIVPVQQSRDGGQAIGVIWGHMFFCFVPTNGQDRLDFYNCDVQICGKKRNWDETNRIGIYVFILYMGNNGIWQGDSRDIYIIYM